MNDQWLMTTKIRNLIADANKYDIEINEITVSASAYNQLMNDAVVSAKFYDSQMTEYALRIGSIVIRKRACKGCCAHG